MKINLAENMLRFGVKNLNETSTRKVKILAEQEEKPVAQSTPTTTPASSQQGGERDIVQQTQKAASSGKYTTYKSRMWMSVFSVIVNVPAKGTRINGVSNPLKLQFLTGDTTPIEYWPSKIRNQVLSYKDGRHDKSAGEFNTKFWASYDKKLNDANWVAQCAKGFNNIFAKEADPTAAIKDVQTYVAANVNDKSLVKDNGYGKPFVDGVWGVNSAKAWLTMVRTDFTPSNTLDWFIFQNVSVVGTAKDLPGAQ